MANEYRVTKISCSSKRTLKAWELMLGRHLLHRALTVPLQIKVTAIEKGVKWKAESTLIENRRVQKWWLCYMHVGFAARQLCVAWLHSVEEVASSSNEMVLLLRQRLPARCFLCCALLPPIHRIIHIVQKLLKIGFPPGSNATGARS